MVWLDDAGRDHDVFDIRLRLVLQLSHLSTIRLLRQWAKWGECNLDYPTHSSHMSLHIKTPLLAGTHIPPEIAEVEHAVGLLSFDLRDALIQRYQRHATWTQIGDRLGLSWRGAKRRTIEAENEVHTALTGQITYVTQRAPCITV